MADLNDTIQLLTATVIQMNETINGLQKQLDVDQQYSIETQNHLYLILTGVLVFFMQTGFGMLEAGSVSSEHAPTVILKNLLDAGVSALCYWAIGFPFAFGDKSHNGFIGSGYWFLSDMPSETRSMPFWFFEITFCATAATIVSGAVAERIRVQGYLLHTAFMSAFIYPVVSHWMWSSDGWLSITNADNRLFGTGAIDFAGDSCVHLVGGVAALMGAKMVGYRGQYSPPNAKDTNKPRFQQVSGKWIVNDLPSSSGLLACLGCFILWTGWYGFNCGSVIAIYRQTNTSGRVAVNTTLAAASGSLGAVLYGRVERRNSEEKYTLNDAINGILAGLVAITGPCAVVEPWAAVVIGLVGSAVYRVGSRLLLHPRIMIDDPVEAVPVHLFNGAWGLLAVGIFAKNKYIEEAFSVDGDEFNGIIYGQGRLLACQIVTILVVGAWTAFWSGLVFVIFAYVDRNRRGEDLIFLEKGGHIDKTGFGASAVNVVIEEEDEQEMDEEVGRRQANKSNESVQLPATTGNTSKERKSFKSSSRSSSPDASNTKIKPAAAYSSDDDSSGSSDVHI